MTLENPRSAVTPECWGKSELLKKLLLAGRMGNLEVVPQRREGQTQGTKPWSDEDREWNFWARLSYSEYGCWLWQGGKIKSGYGSVRWAGPVCRAHAIARMLTSGPIPKGLFVLHKCDTPACCRPDHLFLGTNTDNMRDMSAKGRTGIHLGESNVNAKLNVGIVRAIRRAWTPGYGSCRRLAAKLGISEGSLSSVVHGRTWGWVK